MMLRAVLATVESNRHARRHHGPRQQRLASADIFKAGLGRRHVTIRVPLTALAASLCPDYGGT